MLKIVYNNHAQTQKLVLVKINQIFITEAIIKEALCFLSDDDSITENEDMNMNNISGSYVSNI